MSKSQPKNIAKAIPALIGVTRETLEVALKALSAPGGKPVKTSDDFMGLFAQHGAQPLFTPPAIGEYWPGQGGIYAGQVREADGTIYHQIHAAPKPRLLNHGASMKFASSLVIDGHSDFVLPSRRGARVLCANLADRFESGSIWTSETYEGDASYAWSCYFGYGYTHFNRKSYERQAVAVRRFRT